MQMTATPNHASEIRNFVITNFLFGEAGSLRDDTSFMGGGIIDSTGILELVMFIEETYKIKVEPEEMLPENLDSVNRVAAFVARKLFKEPGSIGPVGAEDGGPMTEVRPTES